MKHKTKNTLRLMARHLGLKPKFVSYLSDDVHGRLLIREKRILLNANKPRTEHIFTMLHEIAHFWLHHLQRHRTRHPSLCDIDWNNNVLSEICLKTRRLFRLLFCRERYLEFEADLWAFCAFMVLAKSTGCHDDLTRFVERHPEKWRVYLLAGFGIAYSRLKTGFRALTKPLRWLPKVAKCC